MFGGSESLPLWPQEPSGIAVTLGGDSSQPNAVEWRDIDGGGLVSHLSFRPSFEFSYVDAAASSVTDAAGSSEYALFVYVDQLSLIHI